MCAARKLVDRSDEISVQWLPLVQSVGASAAPALGSMSGRLLSRFCRTSTVPATGVARCDRFELEPDVGFALQITEICRTKLPTHLVAFTRQLN